MCLKQTAKTQNQHWFNYKERSREQENSLEPTLNNIDNNKLLIKDENKNVGNDYCKTAKINSKETSNLNKNSQNAAEMSADVAKKNKNQADNLPSFVNGRFYDQNENIDAITQNCLTKTSDGKNVVKNQRNFNDPPIVPQEKLGPGSVQQMNTNAKATNGMQCKTSVTEMNASKTQKVATGAPESLEAVKTGGSSEFVGGQESKKSKKKKKKKKSPTSPPVEDVTHSPNKFSASSSPSKQDNSKASTEKTIENSLKMADAGPKPTAINDPKSTTIGWHSLKTIENMQSTSPLKLFSIVGSALNQPEKHRLDPVRDVFDVPVKIADLGNACWTVSLCLFFQTLSCQS